MLVKKQPIEDWVDVFYKKRYECLIDVKLYGIFDAVDKCFISRLRVAGAYFNNAETTVSSINHHLSLQHIGNLPMTTRRRKMAVDLGLIRPVQSYGPKGRVSWKGFVINKERTLELDFLLDSHLDARTLKNNQLNIRIHDSLIEKLTSWLQERNLYRVYIDNQKGRV